MVAGLSLFSLALGAALASLGARTPSHAARLEAWGGTFLVTGLALLGAALPLFR